MQCHVTIIDDNDSTQEEFIFAYILQSLLARQRKIAKELDHLNGLFECQLVLNSFTYLYFAETSSSFRDVGIASQDLLRQTHSDRQERETHRHLVLLESTLVEIVQLKFKKKIRTFLCAKYLLLVMFYPCGIV